MHYPHAPGPYPFTALAPYPHVQHQHYPHPPPPKNDTHGGGRVAGLGDRIADLERQRTELEELTVGYMTQKEDWKEKCLSLHKKYKLKKQKLEGTTKRLHQLQCVLSRGANYVMCTQDISLFTDSGMPVIDLLKAPLVEMPSARAQEHEPILMFLVWSYIVNRSTTLTTQA